MLLKWSLVTIEITCSALDEDFYSNLASQAGEDADSEVSDVDAKQMARDLGVSWKSSTVKEMK